MVVTVLFFDGSIIDISAIAKLGSYTPATSVTKNGSASKGDTAKAKKGKGRKGAKEEDDHDKEDGQGGNEEGISKSASTAVAAVMTDSYAMPSTVPPPAASYDPVGPLLNFFELVHVADLVQQMVHIYYKQEMVRFVDEHDFLNGCNSEKKAFERNLDDSVACGLDQSINVRHPVFFACMGGQSVFLLK